MDKNIRNLIIFAVVVLSIVLSTSWLFKPKSGYICESERIVTIDGEEFVDNNYSIPLEGNYTVDITRDCKLHYHTKWSRLKKRILT